jgi:hypothetical protein
MKRLIGIVLFLLLSAGIAMAENSASYCEANADKLLASANGPIADELRLYIKRQAVRQNVSREIFSHMLAVDLCKKGRLPLDQFLAKLSAQKAKAVKKQETKVVIPNSSASAPKSEIKIVSGKNAYKFSNEELNVPPTH